MAHLVMRLWYPRLSRLIVLTALSAAPAWAEVLPDPMRPAVSEGRDAKIADAAESQAQFQAGESRALQSIILRKGQRPSAIINGQWVELGERVDGARVVSIRESEVVLRGPAGQEVLRLTPAVDKQPVRVTSSSQNSIVKKRVAHVP